MNKCIGKIVNTHGIRGELKVSYSDDSLFVVNELLMLNINGEIEEHVLKTKRIHKNHLLITLSDFNNINQVLKYKGCDIYIDSNGEVFLSDLVSYSVFTNKKVGVVNEIITNGAHDILVLDNGSMIPYVDEFILQIDDDTRTIFINEIEGLLNED